MCPKLKKAPCAISYPIQRTNTSHLPHRDS
jgi:hypothetical protein